MQDPDLNLLVTAAKKAGELAKNYDFRKLKVSEKEGGAGPVTAVSYTHLTLPTRLPV